VRLESRKGHAGDTRDPCPPQRRGRQVLFRYKPQDDDHSAMENHPPHVFKKLKGCFMLNGDGNKPLIFKNENQPPDILARQRIMLVDNDQDMLSFLNNTLENEGFDTIVVADIDSAINLLESVKPDLVVLDTMSPEQDNLEILDRMRKHSKVPIIMLSTEYKAEKMREALSHGADDYIRIPFGVKPFIARVHAKLRRNINTNNNW
jgi:CheY-like chemotaxis protein